MLVIAAAALGLRLLFLSQPLAWFVSIMVADDFFYYAGTAYHMAHGAGSTIDGGLTQHNGYHPLFLWLLTPGFMVGLSKTTMILVAMSVLTAAWLAAMMLAYRIGCRLGNAWSALVAPAIMGLNVELAKLTLSGFETALATALVLATVLATLQHRPAWLVGLLLGLAGLARLDSGLVGVPLALFLIQQKRWRDLAVSGLVATLVVAPWSLWSLTNFGSPLPLSGVVKSWFGRPDDLWRGPVVYARETIYRLLGFQWREILPPELAIAAGTLLLAAVVRRGREAWWVVLYALGAPVVYAVLTGSHHLAQFTRYCTPAFCLTAVLFFANIRSRQQAVLALLVSSVLWANLRFMTWSLQTPPLPNYVGLSQREVPAVLEEIVGPNDLVGCFDSGAMSYFAARPIVNLDGLANAEVVRMLAAETGGSWTRRYLDYCHSKGITIIAGGTRYSWVNLFPDLESWTELHEPLAMSEGGEIVFLRVPARGP